jgi:translation initiation factor 5
MEGKKLLNIRPKWEDPNYRYKMPSPIIKIEGKGNGIRTHVVNLSDICKKLKVPD